MDAKKKVFLCRMISVLLLSAVIFLVTVPVVKVLNSPYRVVIKDKDMNYYRAGNVFICGNTLICKGDSEVVKERSMVPEENRDRFSFKLLSMQNIVSIEVLQDEEMVTDELTPGHPVQLGRFKIHLQGHEGILLLGVSDERVYGSVRFPQWGRGATETLKGLRIIGGEVKFIRSASTPEEVKRLGANYLFKQKFSGKYSSSGKVIKGFMVNDRGEKHEWEAIKK